MASGGLDNGSKTRPNELGQLAYLAGLPDGSHDHGLTSPSAAPLVRDPLIDAQPSEFAWLGLSEPVLAVSHSQATFLDVETQTLGNPEEIRLIGAGDLGIESAGEGGRRPNTVSIGTWRSREVRQS